MAVIVNGSRKTFRDPFWVLFVEPQGPPAERPVVDLVTTGMAALLKASEPMWPPYPGGHRCSCGASSDEFDRLLPTGDIANSLAVHYLAWHRHELDGENLGICLTLARRAFDVLKLREEAPGPEQLQPPDPSRQFISLGAYRRRRPPPRSEAV